jgi:hypothetical protein
VTTYDQRHYRVLFLLFLEGPLTFERLQAKAKLRRSDDEFGLVMGDLSEKRGKCAADKPVEWWREGETRLYGIKSSAVLAAMVVPK